MKSIISLLLIVFSTTIFAQNADDIVGVWWTEDKDGKVEIYKKGDVYYGKLIWLKEPNENGKPKLDDENPDPKLRNRPLQGLVLLSGLVFEGDEWDDGEIYDPESGDTYSCYVELESPNRLKLRGYIGFSLIGRSSYWTRAE